MTATPRLAITELVSGQALPETRVNEGLVILEFFANGCHFKSRATNMAEPGSPAEGDAYLLTGTPTGTHWAGQGGKIALFYNGAWTFKTAKEGFIAWVDDENVIIAYDGAAWIVVASGTPYTSENARDDIGSAVVGGDGITITPNDGADTITVDWDGGVVNVGTPAAGEVLTWDDGAGEWVSAPAPGSGGTSGGTVPNGGTLGQTLTKQSGVDQDAGWQSPGYLGVLHCYEEQASGKAGGASVGSAWAARGLNTTFLNTITGASRPTSTVTMTIASPGVITWTGHGLVAGAAVSFTTTGALPTGITAGTNYYVVSPTTNTFSVAATPGGTAINTTGSQSGTHTAQSGTIVLPAGTYEVNAGAPCFASQANKIRLYDATGAASLIDGETLWTSTGTIERRLRIVGRFTIGVTSNVRVEIFSSVTVSSNGFGVDAALGINNHFTDIFIRRVA
jgi:hypothetical protein